MRRRLLFLLPDLSSARRTMDDLLLARVEERHIHFIARDDLSMDGRHDANMLQRSDVVHAAQQSLLLGAADKVLLMVDVPEHHVEEIRERLHAAHPEAEDRGLDPHVPAFP